MRNDLLAYIALLSSLYVSPTYYQYDYFDDGSTYFREGCRLITGVGYCVLDQAITPLGFGDGSVENTDWKLVHRDKLP